jgi:hypothetical protein
MTSGRAAKDNGLPKVFYPPDIRLYPVDWDIYRMWDMSLVILIGSANIDNHCPLPKGLFDLSAPAEKV